MLPGALRVLEGWMTVVLSPSPQFPQARLGSWPLVCWQDWGGNEATSNCPGKTSSLLTSLLSRRRGKRPGRAHPMPGSYPSACRHLPPPPSSSALGQNRHRPQGLVAGSLNSGRSGSQAGRRQEAPKQAQRLLSEGSALPGAHSLPISGPRPGAMRTGSLSRQEGGSPRPGLLYLSSPLGSDF